MKKTFEQTNFKINNPLLFATIDTDKNLILRNRNEFINVYENLLYKSTKETKHGIKLIDEQFI